MYRLKNSSLLTPEPHVPSGFVVLGGVEDLCWQLTTGANSVELDKRPFHPSRLHTAKCPDCQGLLSRLSIYHCNPWTHPQSTTFAATAHMFPFVCNVFNPRIISNYRLKTEIVITTPIDGYLWHSPVCFPHHSTHVFCFVFCLFCFLGRTPWSLWYEYGG